MANCFSFTASRNTCYKYSFSSAGLKSSTTDLKDGTIMHFWVPKTHKQNKPTLLLIHGMGANAMWQWNEFISPLSSKFNIYVPDLVFFGESYTTRPERTEAFQAQCVMKTMEAHGVKKMIVVGISYGGFVGYSMALQFPDAVEKLVLGCSGVCLEEKDMEDGMFQVKSVDEAADILLPRTPEKLRELMKLSFYKPQKNIPSCFLADFIDVMCVENRQEKIELIQALHKDRKFSNLPKITQVCVPHIIMKSLIC
ncbi:OLC1v1009308C1 [Oldenlandia corymbosa var. corymbosa]|uniref:OLC1v1009308C1 n=1 Tax=Oldenlandia corymbosa var. corymbosa TaxID=529605 RepID=A0AAV1DRX9_OLDCO|nr:OLC1v1009308C1 [Oldenlandia corymbosa var. corymbosa]